jgi:D-inositol-3-phosphate glycosyltransferase
MEGAVKKPRLLWVGHAGTLETGFGRISDNVLHYLAEAWDVSVLGIGYNGDPHDKPYRIYPASLGAGQGGDPWGLHRLKELVVRERTDLILIAMEPWNIVPYVQELRVHLKNAVKIAAYCVVDGENMKRDHAKWLSQLDMTIFPTTFAMNQARTAGFTGRWWQLPHGVDPQVFQPCDRLRARQMIGIGQLLEPDSFVVGNVNMNQPRKRIDLTLQAWAEWWHGAMRPPNAFIYLHTNKHSEVGWDLGNLAQAFGIKGRVIVPTEDFHITEQRMKYVYNSLDVQVTTTCGEGWGLTTLEGMACGVPQIVPNFAALGEWVDYDAAIKVEAPAETFMANQQNVRRYAPQPADVAAAIQKLWNEPDLRAKLGRAGRQLAMEYAWPIIAKGFHLACLEGMESRGVEGKHVIEGARGPSGATVIPQSV